MKARYFFLLTTLIELVLWPAYKELARHFAPTVYTYHTHSIQVSRNHQLSVAGTDTAGTDKEGRQKTQ